jgi:hypothetical protein
MIASIVSILAYLVPFLLDAWKENSPERKKEKQYAEIQTGRSAVAVADVGAIAGRIDRLLSVQVTGPAGGGVAGLQSAEDVSRRLGNL